MAFDLMEIKKEVEKHFDIKFKVIPWILNNKEKALEYVQGYDKLTIHLSHYTYPAKLGVEFISGSYDHNGGGQYYGQSCSGDSIEQLLQSIERVKVFPKRSQFTEEPEQLSLF